MVINQRRRGLPATEIPRTLPDPSTTGPPLMPPRCASPRSHKGSRSTAHTAPSAVPYGLSTNTSCMKRAIAGSAPPMRIAQGEDREIAATHLAGLATQPKLRAERDVGQKDGGIAAIGDDHVGHPMPLAGDLEYDQLATIDDMARGCPDTRPLQGERRAAGAIARPRPSIAPDLYRRQLPPGQCRRRAGRADTVGGLWRVRRGASRR